MVFYPELLKFNDGSDVGCTKCWSRRREEILEILQREEYGYVPKLPETVRILPSSPGVTRTVSDNRDGQECMFCFLFREGGEAE